MIGGIMRLFSNFISIICTVFVLTACTLPVDLKSTSPAPGPTEEPISTQTITIWFTDEEKFAVGTEPYEVAVTRQVPPDAIPMRAVLDAFFAGPTPEEIAQGLMLVASGFTGVREINVENGIARIYMEGKCANNGAAYSVANLISKNLEQFPQITAIKIYDENGDNLDPDSAMSSLPYCLEP